MKTSISMQQDTYDDIVKYKSPTLSKDEDEVFSVAISDISTNYFNLLNHSLREVQSYLTLGEAKCICDIMYGWMFTSDLDPVQSLIINLQSANQFTDLSEKWEINLNTLVNKISELSATQVFVIINLAKNFWKANEDGLASDTQIKDIFKGVIK